MDELETLGHERKTAVSVAESAGDERIDCSWVVSHVALLLAAFLRDADLFAFQLIDAAIPRASVDYATPQLQACDDRCLFGLAHFCG